MTEVFQVAQRAEDLERARAFSTMPHGVISEPYVIFRHTDDVLGPAGTTEQMAFLRDSEGNTVGLVSHAPTGS